MKLPNLFFTILFFGFLSFNAYSLAIAQTVVAFDDFESGNFSGGTGWSDASWIRGSNGQNTRFAVENVNGATYEARIAVTAAGDPFTLTRSLNLAAYPTGNQLSFDLQADTGAETNVTIRFNYGSGFVEINTISLSTSSSPKQTYTYNLGESITGSVQAVQFESNIVPASGGRRIYFDNITVSSIPEPTHTVLLLGTLVLLGYVYRRNNYRIND